MPEPTDQLEPGTDSSAVVHSRGDGSRLPLDKRLAIHALASQGKSATEIAQIVESDPRTIHAALSKRYDTKEAIKHLLADDALAALSDWQTARQVAASKGKHLPAKDWLQHADLLDNPAPSHADGSARISVVIGIQGQPAGTDQIGQLMHANSLRVSSLTGGDEG